MLAVAVFSENFSSKQDHIVNNYEMVMNELTNRTRHANFPL